jgi:hypothetical protein
MYKFLAGLKGVANPGLKRLIEGVGLLILGGRRMHLNTVVIAVFCWIDKQGCYLTVFLMPFFLSALRTHVFDAIFNSLTRTATLIRNWRP